MRLGPRIIETLGPREDHTWLGSETGTNDAKTIILDSAAFTAVYADGVAKSGTIIAQHTGTKRWHPYTAGGANGTGTAAGVLFTTVDVSGGNNSPAARLWHGQLIAAKLPRQSGAGSLDADARTALRQFDFI